MSHLLSEQNTSSSSPARPDSTPTPAVDSSQRETNSENSLVSNQNRVSNEQQSTNTVTSTSSRGHPLHEFHSLLEAAQRIANSAPFDTEGNRWREDDQPEPIIYLNRRREGHPPRRRVPLTRQYSGRPHVPGEDSGSDGGMDDVEIETGRNTDRQEDDMDTSAEGHDSTEGLSRTQASPIATSVQNTHGDDPFQLAAGNGRTRDRQPEEEEERDLFEQALARSREVRSRFEAESRWSHLAQNQRSRYSTTAPSPTQDSFYDWAPEPAQPRTTDSIPSWRPRSRAGSIRRWRPAERLQDYASNTARRDSNSSTQTLQPSASQSTPRAIDTREHGQSARNSNNSLGSHEDVVDRVERALQQYRIARRALRVSNDDTTVRPSSNQAATLPPSLRDLARRSPPNPQESSELSNMLQSVTDIMDGTADPDSDDRAVPSTFGFGDNTNSTSPTRSNPAPRDRREEPLRQRIREQVRERRRRVLQSLEQEQSLSITRGPLFEGSSNLLSNRTQLDTRRMLEKIRNEEAKERCVELKRAKAALQYLARLREPDMDEVKAWTVASDLGLHNQSLEEDSKTHMALSTKDLQKPTFSSWLEPGMTWTGVQDANDSESTSNRTNRQAGNGMFTSAERPEPVSPQHESFRTRMGAARDRLERNLLADGGSEQTGRSRNSMQVLEDAERSLSHMLERSEELLRENARQLRDNEQQLRENRERLRETDRRLMLLDEAVRLRSNPRSRRNELRQTTGLSSQTDGDRWNVKVTLHSMDTKQMTVSGTMTASHRSSQPLPDKSDSDTGQDQEKPDDTSMDSFFTGDIVDLTTHGLDTTSRKQSENLKRSTNIQHRRQQDEWRVGGPETDLSYWAGLGPFKREINLALRKKGRQNDLSRAMQIDEINSDKQIEDEFDGRSADQIMDDPDKVSILLDSQEGSAISTLSEEQVYAVKMETMARLLCDTKWLNENIGTSGWILMRWKERCFVSPGTDPNPDVRRPWIPSQSPGGSYQARTQHLDIDAGFWNTSNDSTTHDIIRRRRERDARVWSTNAAEREELGISDRSLTPRNVTSSVIDPGTRQQQQPTWGLTISGFYYVALERKTGRIEALYYDHGSTPFQKLKMNPQTIYTASLGTAGPATGTLNSSTSDITGDGGTSSSTVDLEASIGTGGSSEPRVDLSGVSGLKTNFNLVEFR